jgi:Glycosyltransferase family 87
MGPISRAERREWLCITIGIALLAGGSRLHSGFLGWSWDAINHHVYLGLVAQGSRWHLDVIPASTQSYQVPYLYWPVYLMSQWSGPPAVAAGLWAALQAAAVIAPTWLISHRLMPHTPIAVERIALRAVACAAALLSLVLWASIETTANDLLSAVPLLWALAISLHPEFDDRRATLASMLWGLATALKLSNGLFLPWLLLWWYRPRPPHWPWRRALCILGGAGLGFGVAYAPWGWHLWQATGNPFHPFFGGWFPRS